MLRQTELNSYSGDALILINMSNLKTWMHITTIYVRLWHSIYGDTVWCL